MQDFLIYGGIIIDIAGAIFLGLFAMKAAHKYNLYKDKPIDKEQARQEWGKKRMIGWGLIILGTIIAFIGTMI